VKQVQRPQTLEEEYADDIPKGYRFTTQARQRLMRLDSAKGAPERRRLAQHFAREDARLERAGTPFETFELIERDA